MVDAGLTFNSPFPLVLRPQRAVDIILSFDFSARPGDQSPPFKVHVCIFFYNAREVILNINGLFFNYKGNIWILQTNVI